MIEALLVLLILICLGLIISLLLVLIRLGFQIQNNKVMSAESLAFFDHVQAKLSVEDLALALAASREAGGEVLTETEFGIKSALLTALSREDY